MATARWQFDDAVPARRDRRWTALVGCLLTLFCTSALPRLAATLLPTTLLSQEENTSSEYRTAASVLPGDGRVPHHQPPAATGRRIVALCCSSVRQHCCAQSGAPPSARPDVIPLRC